MEHTINRMLRKWTALLLVLAMLLPTVAYAAPEAGVLVLPQMLSAIEEQAFQGNTAIRQVEIPENVVSIGAEAFEGCSALETVLIPDSVEEIGENAFANCGDVVIQCTRESYAYRYAKLNGLTVDCLNEEFVAEFEQMIDTVYMGGCSGYLMGVGELTGWDEELHGDVKWTLTCLEEDQENLPVQLYIAGDNNEAVMEKTGAEVWLRYHRITGVGEVSYELKVECEGFTATETYTIAAAEMPEDLPTGIVYVGETAFEQGDTMSANSDCVELVGGNYSVEDENVRFVLPNIDQ